MLGRDSGLGPDSLGSSSLRSSHNHSVIEGNAVTSIDFYRTSNHICIRGDQPDRSERIKNGDDLLRLRTGTNLVQKGGRQFLKRLN